eukprot:jgi/Tetstr1/439688/TSEL_028107.t1
MVDITTTWRQIEVTITALQPTVDLLQKADGHHYEEAAQSLRLHVAQLREKCKVVRLASLQASQAEAVHHQGAKKQQPPC